MNLALAQGLENTTTEAIAAAAGISTRTFFNYFPNKEAAAIGVPPGFQEADKAALREGTSSLAVDLKRFLDRHMAVLAEDEATLRMVRKVVHSNDKASGVLDRILIAERDELVACLCDRANDPHITGALADNAVGCMSRAIHLWENDESVPLAKAFDLVWAGQIAGSRLLSGSSECASSDTENSPR
ncbi:TetR family transcriptional regulator [Thalassovita gelatinovora]|uniref:TetR family transcriptional regulator n=1 Tax=Thalassovita gelatinovora TaxID=53501 RepID=UPI00130E590F|nr:TetR family transcriptional regulator [Thalassovita gelatinovora]QIZ82155.1 TetR family transcriptional regulator [Thalassovita gelatinovora]